MTASPQHPPSDDEESAASPLGSITYTPVPKKKTKKPSSTQNDDHPHLHQHHSNTSICLLIISTLLSVTGVGVHFFELRFPGSGNGGGLEHGDSDFGLRYGTVTERSSNDLAEAIEDVESKVVPGGLAEEYIADSTLYHFDTSGVEKDEQLEDKDRPEEEPDLDKRGVDQGEGKPQEEPVDQEQPLQESAPTVAEEGPPEQTPEDHGTEQIQHISGQLRGTTQQGDSGGLPQYVRGAGNIKKFTPGGMAEEYMATMKRGEDLAEDAASGSGDGEEEDNAEEPAEDAVPERSAEGGASDSKHIQAIDLTLVAYSGSSRDS